MGKSLPAAPLQLILAKDFSEIFRKIQRSIDRPDWRRLQRRSRQSRSLTVADRRGGGILSASGRHRVAEEPSASRWSVCLSGLALESAGCKSDCRMALCGCRPRRLIYYIMEVMAFHARARSFCRSPIHDRDRLSMSACPTLRLALGIAAGRSRALSSMICLSRGFRFFFAVYDMVRRILS